MQSEAPTPFLIGKNARGQWIAQKQSGRCGGFFISREAAVKFALQENGRRREAIVIVPETIELDLGERTYTVHTSTFGTPSAAVTASARSVTDQNTISRAA
jgi:hypothetical protein